MKPWGMTPVEKRLSNRISMVPESGCWIWTGSINNDGYGKITSGGRRLFVHRLSYELHIGPIPKGMCVLHRCDIPCCVNPTHLFLGTQLDNIADRHKKNRNNGHKRAGERHAQRKLNMDQVELLRKLVAEDGSHGATTRAARKIGISSSQAYRIINRTSWKDYAI